LLLLSWGFAHCLTQNKDRPPWADQIGAYGLKMAVEKKIFMAFFVLNEIKKGGENDWEAD